MENSKPKKGKENSELHFGFSPEESRPLDRLPPQISPSRFMEISP